MDLKAINQGGYYKMPLIIFHGNRFIITCHWRSKWRVLVSLGELEGVVFLHRLCVLVVAATREREAG